jgi:hypothetical protein
VKRWIVPLDETHRAEIVAGVHPFERGKTVTVDLLFLPRHPPFGQLSGEAAVSLGLALLDASKEAGAMTAKLKDAGKYLAPATRLAHGAIMDHWRCARCRSLLVGDPIAMTASTSATCVPCGGNTPRAVVETVEGETAPLEAARDPKRKRSKADR